MSGENGYYTHHYQGMDPRQSAGAMGQNVMDSLAISGMDTNLLDEGQSLDDIINQNNRELQRRRDTFSQYPANTQSDSAIRRASMMEFGSLNDDLADFQFDPNPSNPMLSQINGSMPSPQKTTRKVKSREDIASDMKYSTNVPTMGDLNNMTGFSNPVDFGGNLNLDTAAQYQLSANDVDMDFVDASGNVTPMNVPSGLMETAIYSQSPQQNFISSYSAPGQDSGAVTNTVNEPGTMVHFSHGQRSSTKSGLQSDAHNEVSKQPQTTTMGALTGTSHVPQSTSAQELSSATAFGLNSGGTPCYMDSRTIRNKLILLQTLL